MARVKLDLKGLEAAASSPEMRRAVEDVAEEVAENVRSQGRMVGGESGEVPIPVKVFGPDVTSNMRVDRARASVYLAHPAGMAVQAKYGALSRAVSEAGLRLREAR